MKVLVTGGTGFVGSHILDELILRKRSNPELQIYASRRYHLSRRDKVLHIGKEVSWVDCDVTDSVAVNKVFSEISPDWCLHMASESFVSPSWNHPSRYMSVNYNGTLNVLEAIKNFAPKCRILIPGSGEEYGDIHEEELPIDEFTPLRPVNPYAVTKIAQDLISYVYFRSFGINAIRLRTFNHEGPRREHYFGIASYAYQIAKIETGLQKPIIYVGHLDDLRNFTHVKDIVRAYFLALERAEPGELYLVGNNKSANIATFRQALDQLIDLSCVPSNVEVKVSPELVRPTAVPRLIASTDSFSKKFEWSVTYSLQEILEDTLNYWRDRVKHYPNM